MEGSDHRYTVWCLFQWTIWWCVCRTWFCKSSANGASKRKCCQIQEKQTIRPWKRQIHQRSYHWYQQIPRLQKIANKILMYTYLSLSFLKKTIIRQYFSFIIILSLHHSIISKLFISIFNIITLFFPLISYPLHNPSISLAFLFSI